MEECNWAKEAPAFAGGTTPTVSHGASLQADNSMANPCVPAKPTTNERFPVSFVKAQLLA